MLNLKITKTYSISKLLRNFDNLIDKTLAASAKDTEEQSKMNIDNSRTHIDNPMQPLSAATKKVSAATCRPPLTPLGSRAEQSTALQLSPRP